VHHTVNINMQEQFSGKVIALTGAASGIGLATVSKLMGKAIPRSETFTDPFAHHF
jgi:hypothetical protein